MIKRFEQLYGTGGSVRHRALARSRREDGAEGGGGGEGGKPAPKVGDTKPAARSHVSDTQTGDGQGKTFTQDEVNALMTAEANKAKSSARKQIAEELGVEKLDEAKAVLDAKAAADEAAKDELTKATEAATTAQAEAAAAMADAKIAQIKADLVVAFGGDEENAPLRQGKVNPALAIGLPIAMAHDGDSAEAVAEAVKAVREQASEFFGESDGSGRGTGTPKPPTKPGGESKPPATDLDAQAKAAFEQAQAAMNIGIPSRKEPTS